MPTPTELRQALSDLSTLAAADLREVWRQVATPDQAVAALEEVLPPLVTTYSTAAAAVAADWYDDLRAEQNIDGRFSAIVNDIDDRSADVLARWGASPLFQAEPDWDRAATLIEGGTQLRIANTAREVVMGSSIEDPGARGWQRVGDGNTCGFCSMLISRGAIYSQSTATFAAHDSCGCMAAPAFSDRTVPVQPYTPSERIVTDADRRRVREYLARNPTA